MKVTSVSSSRTTEERTTEELQTQQHTEVLQEIGDAEEVISTSETKEMGMWEKLSDICIMPNSFKKG